VYYITIITMIMIIIPVISAQLFIINVLAQRPLRQLHRHHNNNISIASRQLKRHRRNKKKLHLKAALVILQLLKKN